MQYCAPRTLAEATALLSDSGAGLVRVMAGGTDLLARMATGSTPPDRLLDLKKIPELNALVRHDDGAYTLGAAVCGAILSEHAELRRDWPGVTEAMELIGSVQIQGRASLGGNLCNASPAADAVPALIAARALCRVLGATGERTLPVEEVIVSPGRTCLRSDEILISLHLPARPDRSADAYLRMIPRTEMDIAIAGAAVSLVLNNNGVIDERHVALGAVSPVPVLVASAAEQLIGSMLDEQSLGRFRARVSAACRPINDKRGTIEYRSHIAAVLAVRAAVIARQRALSRAVHTGERA